MYLFHKVQFGAPDKSFGKGLVSSVFTDLVHPELANNDVVDGGGHLAAGVVVLRAAEDQVSNALWQDLQVLATELAGHGVILPILPQVTLSMHSRGWRVVGHLEMTNSKQHNNRYS